MLEKVCEIMRILTKLELVLLLSSSGMGRNTAKAIQFAKMVNKMMISKVLDGKTQDHNSNTCGGLVKSQLPRKKH